MLELLDMRAYARTKELIDPRPEEKVPTGPMVDRVKASVAELLRLATAAKETP